MSSLAKCAECDGEGTKAGKTCQWCEGFGVIEVKDQYRARKIRPKGWLKKAIEAGDVAPEGHDYMAAKAERSPDATVVVCPPARATLRPE